MKVNNNEKRSSVRRTDGFTMIEIAISMAIAAFALVAILGNLPKGMQVQRENREDTLINQDAVLLMEGIKNGARGFRGLSNQVDQIDISSSSGFSATYTDPLMVFSAERVVGLLSTPKYQFSDNTGTVAWTNDVFAVVRSISGSSGEKDPDLSDFAFKYRVHSEIVPFTSLPSNFSQTFTNTPSPHLVSLAPPATGTLNQTNNWRRARSLNQNLYELKLTFQWPVLADGSVGRRKKVYRTLVQSTLVQTNLTSSVVGYFFSSPPASN